MAVSPGGGTRRKAGLQRAEVEKILRMEEYRRCNRGQ